MRWIKGDLIGKGTYGRVYLALNATTGEMIAVKQVEVNPKAHGQDNDIQITRPDRATVSTEAAARSTTARAMNAPASGSRWLVIVSTSHSGSDIDTSVVISTEPSAVRREVAPDGSPRTG